MENDLDFTDWKDYIVKRLGTEPWLMIYSNHSTATERVCFHCALIPDNIVGDVLQNISWDLSFEGGIPDEGSYFNNGIEETSYHRFGNSKGIEPLIVCRTFYGLKESFVEVSEEFRHYFNLYYDTRTRKFIKFNDDGEDEDVIRFSDEKAEVNLKFLKQFLSMKKMHLVIFIDLCKDSSKSLQELGLKETSETLTEDGHIIHHLVSSYRWTHNNKSSAMLIGKKLIKYPIKKPSSYYNHKAYLEFIIAIDEDGNEIAFTCDEDNLSDYFGKNPKAPHYLTPVFFKREVLTKYYSQPDRYSIRDGSIECGYLGTIPIDNNHANYVIVYLGDLGRLSTEHQQYWRHFNIPPEGTPSNAHHRRTIEAEFADPEKGDLVFKLEFELFCRHWHAKFGWHLFSPLAKEDEHYYRSLRIPLTNEQSEFDSQVLSLTKILIDSINEKELEQRCKCSDVKGIGKLDEFLKSNDRNDYKNHIHFLKKLQGLRSAGVGHRKGSNYLKISKEFSIGAKSFIDIFDDILKKTTEFIVYLNISFLDNKTQS